MKTNNKRLVAAVAVLALVACAFVAFVPSDSADGVTNATAVEGAKDLDTVSGTLAAGAYYVDSDISTAINGRANADITIILGEYGKITLASTINGNITIVSGYKDAGAIYAYNGLEFTGVGGKAYTAVANGGISVLTATTATDFGISVADGTNTVYYPAGTVLGTAAAPVVISNGKSITVKTGTAYISDVDKTYTNEVCVDVVTTTTKTGITVTYATSNESTISGNADSGDVTLMKGAFKAGPVVGFATLYNGFADAEIVKSTVLSAAFAQHVYGTHTKDITTNSGVFLHNATADITIKSAQISAQNVTAKISGSLLINSNVIGDLELVSGSYTIGKRTIGDGTIESELTVAAGATLTASTASTTISVEDKATLSVFGVLAAASESSVTVDDAASTEKTGQFNAYQGARLTGVVISIDNYNISAAMYTQDVSGYANSSYSYAATQILNVVGSWTIVSGTIIYIPGGLIIPEGATMTIESGARVFVGQANNDTSTVNNSATVDVSGNLVIETLNGVNGTFTVAGGKSVDISGSINAEGDLVSTAGTVAIKNGGSVNIEDTGSIAVTGNFKVETGANLNIDGIIASATTISNQGTVTIDNKDAADDSTGTTVAATRGNIIIHLIANGAVADIRSISLSDRVSLTIDDLGLEINKADKIAVDGSTIVANTVKVDDATASGDFESLTVSVSASTKTADNGTKTYTHTLDVNGSVGFTDYTDGTQTVKVNLTANGVKTNVDVANGKVTGGIVVSKTLTCGDFVNVINAGKLTVSGEVYAVADDSSFANNADGVINVDGMIKVVDEITLGQINAAMYEATESGEDCIYYTTLVDAIGAGADEIEIVGTVTLKENAEVPSGTTVIVNTGRTLNIGTAYDRTVTLTVADGAQLNNRGTVNVLGTLIIANENTGLRGTKVLSDVYSTNGTTGTYTNIYTALSGLTSGTVTVTRTGGTIDLNQDLTVPAGVTLVVPAGASQLKLMDGVTLTVEGTLETWDVIAVETAFDTEAVNATSTTAGASAIDVTGVFKSTEYVAYNTTGTPNATTYMTAGAYYSIQETTGLFYYITPVATAAQNAADIENGAISIYGDNSVGDIAFVGTDEEPLTITVYGDVDFGTLTLTYTTVNTLNAEAFDGTIANEAGSVSFTDAKGFTVVSTVESENTVLFVRESAYDADLSNRTDFVMTIVSGNVNARSTSAGVAFTTSEMTIASGATFTVTGANAADIDDLTVEGTLDVNNGGRIVSQDLVVLGTANLGAATTTQAAGSSDINYLYAGITAEDALVSGGYALGADAVINGAFSADAVFVIAGSTVDERVTAEMDYTEYFVNDALYMTVYVAAGTTIDVNDIAYPELPGEAVLGWQVEDSNGRLVDATNEVIGTEDVVTAEVKTDVYTVQIKADSGFSDIYIDGQLVASIGVTQSVNVTIELAVGTHEVSYKLKNGWGGDISVSFNGTQLSGDTFTISSDMPFVEDGKTYLENGNNSIVYKLVFTGAEATGTTPSEGGSTGSSDDGMGLTDYLLIILVILIVIMAIMVAMRLMRS